MRSVLYSNNALHRKDRVEIFLRHGEKSPCSDKTEYILYGYALFIYIKTLFYMEGKRKFYKDLGGF